MAKKDLKESIEIIESPEALREEVSKVEKVIEKNSKTIFNLLLFYLYGYFNFNWF